MNDKYTLTVDIATVDSLGRNLYSNAAAVLSEFVANAWDADATRVEIQFDPNNSISILDNGCGMTDGELNSRFLTVGYRKRVVEGMASPRFKRPYMGRKGIGKLSAFSLADKMVVPRENRMARLTGSPSTRRKWRRVSATPIPQEGSTTRNRWPTPPRNSATVPTGRKLFFPI